MYIPISFWGVSDSLALLGLFHFVIKSLSLLGTLHLILLPELTFLVPVPLPNDSYLLKQSALNSESTLFPAEKKRKDCVGAKSGLYKDWSKIFLYFRKTVYWLYVLPLSSTIKNSMVRIPERRVGQGFQLVLWGHVLAMPTQLKRRKST